MKNSYFAQLEQELTEVRECIDRTIEDLSNSTWYCSEDARDVYHLIRAELYDLQDREFYINEVLAGHDPDYNKIPYERFLDYVNSKDYKYDDLQF